MNTLLIVGLGDVARRALPALLDRYAVTALVRPERVAAMPPTPGLALFPADLDDPASLASLPPARDVAHFAPPPRSGTTDTRTRALLQALSVRPPERIVYVSTSGVYGDCGGARIDESQPVNPQSDRARRRVDAEAALFDFGRRHGTRIAALRTPGIYAADRLPVERLRRGTPVLRPEDDVYTNHIHADDLAAIVVAALDRRDTEGVFNAVDDSELTMGAWFDLVADRAGLPHPPRITRDEAHSRIPPPLLSFMSESRRLLNTKMKAELGVMLRHPTVFDGVPAAIDLARVQGLRGE